MGLGLLLVGCGKEEKAKPVTEADVTPVDTQASASDQEKARIAQAVAIRDGIKPPPPAIKLRGGEPASPQVLAAYNQELLHYIFQNKDAPETMQELLKIRSLPRLPTPPPGKKIVYDPVNRVIRLDPP